MVNIFQLLYTTVTYLYYLVYKLFAGPHLRYLISRTIITSAVTLISMYIVVKAINKSGTETAAQFKEISETIAQLLGKSV